MEKNKKKNRKILNQMAYTLIPNSNSVIEHIYFLAFICVCIDFGIGFGCGNIQTATSKTHSYTRTQSTTVQFSSAQFGSISFNTLTLAIVYACIVHIICTHLYWFPSCFCVSSCVQWYIHYVWLWLMRTCASASTIE